MIVCDTVNKVHLLSSALELLQSSLQPLHVSQQFGVLLGQQVLVQGDLPCACVCMFAAM